MFQFLKHWLNTYLINTNKYNKTDLHFKELKMTKKNYVDGFVFLPLHIYRRHLSPPVRKMCPILNLPLIGETIIIFSNKTFKCSYSKTYTLLNLNLVNIWNDGKNLQGFRGQNPCKNVGLVSYLAIYHNFHGLKLSYIFLISKIIIKEIR